MSDSSTISQPRFRFTLRTLFTVLMMSAGTYVVYWVFSPITDAEFEERVARCDPLVQAVYDYRERTRRWPKELTAVELGGPFDPGYHWSYQFRGEAAPPVLVLHPIMHCTATYHFPDYAAPPGDATNEWKISGDSVRWKRVRSTAIPLDVDAQVGGAEANTP